MKIRIVKDGHGKFFIQKITPYIRHIKNILSGERLKRIYTVSSRENGSLLMMDYESSQFKREFDTLEEAEGRLVKIIEFSRQQAYEKREKEEAKRKDQKIEIIEIYKIR